MTRCFKKPMIPLEQMDVTGRGVNMKVYIDGKLVEVENEVRVVVQVVPRCGIDGVSDLEVCLNAEGINVELVEITANSAPSAEITTFYQETFEEFIDNNMLKEKKENE